MLPRPSRIFISCMFWVWKSYFEYNLNTTRDSISYNTVTRKGNMNCISFGETERARVRFEKKYRRPNHVAVFIRRTWKIEARVRIRSSESQKSLGESFAQGRYFFGRDYVCFWTLLLGILSFLFFFVCLIDCIVLISASRRGLVARTAWVLGFAISMYARWLIILNSFFLFFFVFLFVLSCLVFPLQMV